MLGGGTCGLNPHYWGTSPMVTWRGWGGQPPSWGQQASPSSVTTTTTTKKKNRSQRRYSRFFTISSQRRELSPARTLLKWPGRNRVQITCNTSSAHHVQVSCYVLLGTGRDSSAIKFDRVEIAFNLSFILLAEPLNPWRRGGNRSTQRKPLATSFRKCRRSWIDIVQKVSSHRYDSTWERGESITVWPTLEADAYH